MLGYPISGEVDLTTPLNTYLDYAAAFAQDDWRINSRLTVNLGLRYEGETGLKEDHNQLAVGFDRTATSKLSNGANVTGGILFAGVNGNQRDIGDLSLAKFAPRLGVSYQVKPKTILRGGYGILYAPMRYDPVSSLAPGYNAASSYIASQDNNQTPAGSLENPFPNGFEKPAGNSAGLLTGLGNSVTTYDQNLHAPRVQQFSVGVEQELPGHIALSASYIGSRSTNLSPSPTSSTPININQLNPSNFSLGQSLSDQVANPNYVANGPGIVGQPTVSRSQTLRPFSQFTSVNLFVSSAHADYNALLIKAEKRASHGPQFHHFIYLVAQYGLLLRYREQYPELRHHSTPERLQPRSRILSLGHRCSLSFRCRRHVRSSLRTWTAFLHRYALDQRDHRQLAAERTTHLPKRLSCLHLSKQQSQ